MEPVRVDHAPHPFVPLDDLEAVTLIQQRSVFRATDELAHHLPAERAWRWKRWRERRAEFDEMFGGF